MVEKVVRPNIPSWRDHALKSLEDTFSLPGGGDGGNNGGMDGRIAKLEADMEYVKRDVSELRTDMRDVRDRAVKIEERMATKTFVFSVYGIVSALIAAITLFQGQIQHFLGIATVAQ